LEAAAMRLAEDIAELRVDGGIPADVEHRDHRSRLLSLAGNHPDLFVLNAGACPIRPA
jgi:hypothetical protein